MIFGNGCGKRYYEEIRFEQITNTEQGPLVESNQVWKHTNGNLYIVELIANNEGDNEIKRQKYPETVVYRGENGKVWARRLDDWHRSMTLIGREI
jgi:hypothetical protein